MAQFDEKGHTVPHDLENPIPIMFWDPMEFVMALCFMGFGIVLNLWVLGMGMGAAVLVGSRYLKRGGKRGMMQHLLWAIGLQLDVNLTKRFPPSWVNEFIE